MADLTDQQIADALNNIGNRAAAGVPVQTDNVRNTANTGFFGNIVTGLNDIKGSVSGLAKFGGQVAHDFVYEPYRGIVNSVQGLSPGDPGYVPFNSELIHGFVPQVKEFGHDFVDWNQSLASAASNAVHDVPFVGSHVPVYNHVSTLADAYRQGQLTNHLLNAAGVVAIAGGPVAKGLGAAAEGLGAGTEGASAAARGLSTAAQIVDTAHHLGGAIMAAPLKPWLAGAGIAGTALTAGAEDGLGAAANRAFQAAVPRLILDAAEKHLAPIYDQFAADRLNAHPEGPTLSSRLMSDARAARAMAHEGASAAQAAKMETQARFNVTAQPLQEPTASMTPDEQAQVRAQALNLGADAEKNNNYGTTVRIPRKAINPTYGEAAAILRPGDEGGPEAIKLARAAARGVDRGTLAGMADQLAETLNRNRAAGSSGSAGAVDIYHGPALLAAADTINGTHPMADAIQAHADNMANIARERTAVALAPAPVGQSLDPNHLENAVNENVVSRAQEQAGVGEKSLDRLNARLDKAQIAASKAEDRVDNVPMGRMSGAQIKDTLDSIRTNAATLADRLVAQDPAAAEELARRTNPTYFHGGAAPLLRDPLIDSILRGKVDPQELAAINTRTATAAGLPEVGAASYPRYGIKGYSGTEARQAAETQGTLNEAERQGRLGTARFNKGAEGLARLKTAADATEGLAKRTIAAYPEAGAGIALRDAAARAEAQAAKYDRVAAIEPDPMKAEALKATADNYRNIAEGRLEQARMAEKAGAIKDTSIAKSSRIAAAHAAMHTALDNAGVAEDALPQLRQKVAAEVVKQMGEPPPDPAVAEEWHANAQQVADLTIRDNVKAAQDAYAQDKAVGGRSAYAALDDAQKAIYRAWGKGPIGQAQIAPLEAASTAQQQGEYAAAKAIAQADAIAARLRGARGNLAADAAAQAQRYADAAVKNAQRAATTEATNTATAKEAQRAQDRAAKAIATDAARAGRVRAAQYDGSTYSEKNAEQVDRARADALRLGQRGQAARARLDAARTTEAVARAAVEEATAKATRIRQDLINSGEAIPAPLRAIMESSPQTALTWRAYTDQLEATGTDPQTVAIIRDLAPMFDPLATPEGIDAAVKAGEIEQPVHRIGHLVGADMQGSAINQASRTEAGPAHVVDPSSSYQQQGRFSPLSTAGIARLEIQHAMGRASNMAAEQMYARPELEPGGPSFDAKGRLVVPRRVGGGLGYRISQLIPDAANQIADWTAKAQDAALKEATDLANRKAATESATTGTNVDPVPPNPREVAAKAADKVWGTNGDVHQFMRTHGYELVDPTSRQAVGAYPGAARAPIDMAAADALPFAPREAAGEWGAVNKVTGKLNPALRALQTGNSWYKTFTLPFSVSWQIGAGIGHGLAMAPLGGANVPDMVSYMLDVRRAMRDGTREVTVPGLDQPVPLQQRVAASGIAEDINSRTGSMQTDPNRFNVLARAARASYSFNNAMNSMIRSSMMMAMAEKFASYGEDAPAYIKAELGPKLYEQVAQRAINRAQIEAAAGSPRSFHQILIEEAGARAATRALGDHLQLSPFEQKYMKQVAPFYQWTRHVVTFLGRLAIDHPERIIALAYLGSVYGDPQQGLPSWMQSGIKVGGNVLPLSRLLPFADWGNTPIFPVDQQGDFSLRNIGRLASPVLQLPVAAATGFDPRTMQAVTRPYRDLGPQDSGKMGMHPMSLGQILGYAAQVTPVTRFALNELPAWHIPGTSLTGGPVARFATGESIPRVAPDTRLADVGKFIWPYTPSPVGDAATWRAQVNARLLKARLPQRFAPMFAQNSS